MQTLEIEDVIWRLANLASTAYQEKYVSNGTVDQYVRSDELLQDVDALQFRIDRQENAGLMTELQLLGVRELLRKIEQFPSETLDGADVLTNPHWVQIRQTANAVLKKFGFEATSMSLAEIEELSR